ncbi:MAG: hypothetical protein ABIR24_13685 [Verrucomicrobiota bacterium]
MRFGDLLEKRKNARKSGAYGDVWTFIALDADTKLIPSFIVGKRDMYHARSFMEDLAGRLSRRVQLSSHALHAHPDAVERGFGSEVDYGQLVKTQGVTNLNKDAASRYSPAEVVKTERTIINGMPDVKRITTRAQIGELWQLDASPHRWFPHSKISFPMLNMLDDCSRLFTGSKLYERELLLSCFDFLPAAFSGPRLSPATLRRLPQPFLHARSRRAHALGAAHKFSTLACATPPRRRPRAKSNANTNSGKAVCRLISPAKKSPNWRSQPAHRRAASPSQRQGSSSRIASNSATSLEQRQKRKTFRSASGAPLSLVTLCLECAHPNQSRAATAASPSGSQRLRIEKSPGDKVILCQLPTGHHSVLAHVPDHKQKPVLLFNNRPK